MGCGAGLLLEGLGWRRQWRVCKDTVGIGILFLRVWWILPDFFDFLLLVFSDIVNPSSLSPQARVHPQKLTQDSTLGSHYQSIEVDTLH